MSLDSQVGWAGTVSPGHRPGGAGQGGLHPGLWLSLALVAVLAYGIILRAVGSAEAGVLPLGIVLVASVLSSIGGFAFSAICGALLFHVLDDPVHVVRIMLVCSIASQALMVWSLRQSLFVRPLLPCLAGGIAGLPVGLWLLLHADRVVYMQVIGSLILLYGLYMVCRRPMVLRRQGTLGDMAAGFLGGITGGAAAFPGGPVTIWGTLKGWDKARQRAVYQPFILVMQIVTLFVIAVLRPSGVVTAGFDATSLIYVPLALLGARIGMGCFRGLDERQFAIVLGLLLVISGVALMV